jgi:hypothetical protein
MIFPKVSKDSIKRLVVQVEMVMQLDVYFIIQPRTSSEFNLLSLDPTLREYIEEKNQAVSCQVNGHQILLLPY